MRITGAIPAPPIGERRKPLRRFNLVSEPHSAGVSLAGEIEVGWQKLDLAKSGFGSVS